MWRNWNPLNPPINEQSSEDENNYESPPENDHELVSPNRPHQSPSASPRALLRPDPPTVPEVLANVNQRLRNLPSREERVANRNAVRRAQEAAEAAAAAAAVVVDEVAGNEPEVAMVNYDAEDKADGEKAQEAARHVKVEFNGNDIHFWFSELEGEMMMAGVNRQWLKKTILQRNLPVKVKEDVKSLLSLPQDQAGNSIYLTIKKELLRIYAPKPQDNYLKALSRTMTALPSQLGKQIIDDICRKSPKLEGCCCAQAALAIWSNALPVNIRAHISSLEFTKDTYKEIFETADKVYQSSRQINVAAISLNAAASADETLPAFDPQNQPTAEVAALAANRGGRNQGRGGQNASSGTRGGGRNNRGGGRGGRGGGARPRVRHASNPPESCCDRHYVHGADAWYCLKPQTCPWKDKCVEKPSK